MAFIRSKEKKGHLYYYIVENRRDGPGGSTRQHTVCYIGREWKLRRLAMQGAIGKPGPEGGGAGFTSFEYGAPAALWKVAAELGLEDILDEAMPAKTVKGMARGRVLVLATIHRAVDPGSKAAFSGWAKGTSLPYHLGFRAEDLDSQALWEAMDGVSEEEIDAAQRAIVKRVREIFPDDLGTLHLDYTNYHTWIDSGNGHCVICVRGHNKQKRDDLRQFALAMLTSGTLQVPLVWELYEGNKNDKSEFPDFVEKVARELGAALDLSEVTVAFDGGGNSAEALSSLPFHFVCAHSLAGMPELRRVPLSDFSEVGIGGGRTRLAFRVDDLEFSGVAGTGVLTISDELREGQERQLERDEAALRKRAGELQGRLRNPRARLFTALRAAEREAARDELEARAYNEQLERDQAEGRRTRCRPHEAAPFDEGEAMRRIVEGELFKGKARLRGFWRADLSRDGDGAWTLAVSRDDGARKAYCDASFGRKLTVTDRTDWSTGEILGAYSGQECVEDMFKVTKRADHFSVRPQYHWTDDKIRMHVFMCLCSVTLAEVLRRHAEEAGVVATKHALLDRLGRLHDGWVVSSDGRGAERGFEKLGEEGRRLWAVIDAIPGETLGR